MLLGQNWIREVIDIYWGWNLQMIQIFFVREVGRGGGVLERSLEIA